MLNKPPKHNGELSSEKCHCVELCVQIYAQSVVLPNGFITESDSDGLRRAGEESVLCSSHRTP